MRKPMDTFTYNFGDIVMVGHRAKPRYKTTWYLSCPHCKKQHMFRQTGSKVWHTSCEKSRVEWTITPAEVYVCTPKDMSLILGEE